MDTAEDLKEEAAEANIRLGVVRDILYGTTVNPQFCPADKFLVRHQLEAIRDFLGRLIGELNPCEAASPSPPPPKSPPATPATAP